MLAPSTPHIEAPEPLAPRPYWISRAPVPPSAERYHDGRGVRLYPIPHPEGHGHLAVPGVTSILSWNDSDEDKQRLVDWQAKELAAGRDPNAGRERGTRVHNLIENYIRTGSCDPQCEEDADFFSGVEQYLQPANAFLWSERPMRPGWEHCWSAPKGSKHRIARVWSYAHGFAGTMDAIYIRGNETLVLADFKTSTKPYIRPAGKVLPFQKLGALKFYKTVRQLCAYRLAIKETLGLDINVLQIIVALPKAGQAQNFYIHNPTQINRETEKFKQQCVAFWKAYETA